MNQGKERKKEGIGFKNELMNETKIWEEIVVKGSERCSWELDFFFKRKKKTKSF